ncbi:hypothetical protein L218DRAFT_951489 [Marasmius fiardii PR-910]|nr:hypothetical protein L218DRAFT_951489 [Marasmius fiardii PR-910]
MDQLPFASQDTEMASIPSTINPQMLHSNAFMVGNLGAGGEGFTMPSVNSFQPPSSERNRDSHLPPGKFKARPEVGLIDHLHDDRSMCNLIQCLSLAKTEKDSGWLDEMDRMHTYFAGQEAEERDEAKEKLDRAIFDRDDAFHERDKAFKKRDEAHAEVSLLQKCISELEALVKKLESSESPVTAGSKRKQNDSNDMETDGDASRPSKRLPRSEVIVPSIGFNHIDSEHRPEPDPDLTLIKFGRFRPGIPLHRAVGLSWTERGHIHVFKNKDKRPNVLTIFGTPQGEQIPPSEYSQLAQLEQSASIPGNWSALARCSRRYSTPCRNRKGFTYTQR